MTPRKETLLKLIVEHHIATAQPVGSQFLSALDSLQVSAATIRNEMRDLEAEGYLTHPHTSAGRIPTALGYKYYVSHLLEVSSNTPLPKTLQSLAQDSLDEKDRIKVAAKAISEYIGNAVIVAFNKDALYYTGIGNLFSQPEFKNYEHTVNVSSLFDRCEEVIDSVFDRLAENNRVLIGEENPFGTVCGLVTAPIGDTGLISILGPMRMEYGKALHVLHNIHIVLK